MLRAILCRYSEIFGIDMHQFAVYTLKIECIHCGKHHEVPTELKAV